MTTTLLFPIIASGFAGLAMLALVFGVRSMLSRDANVDARLNTYLGASAGEEAAAAPPESQFAEKLNDAIKQQGFAERIERDLAQANLPLTVPEYLLLRLAVPLILSIVVL